MTFIVLMDRPGKKAARQFYRELNRAIKEGQKIERIQQSCYKVEDPMSTGFLMELGKKYGFTVRAFEVLRELEIEIISIAYGKEVK